jgi:urease gamma subunit
MTNRYRPRYPDNTAIAAVSPSSSADSLAAVINPVAPAALRGRDVVAVAAMLFAAALGVAGVAATFNIVGLTHVFNGAFWPVIAMGIALEVSKLAAIIWLGRRYGGLLLRVAMTGLVTVLMALSAIGSFGFLSSAHVVHVTAHRAAIDLRAADVAARTKVQGAVLADIDGRISLIDAGIAETIRRGRAVAALSLADQQKHNRTDLLLERDQAAQKLASLEIEAAKIQGDRAELAADAGPVRYLAEFFAADADDLVRWFIALVSVLLDPLACALLLAANGRES